MTSSDASANDISLSPLMPREWVRGTARPGQRVLDAGQDRLGRDGTFKIVLPDVLQPRDPGEERS